MSGKILIPLAIIIAGVCIAGALVYINIGKRPSGSFLSPQEAAEKAISFINENMLPEGMEASLINVVEQNDLYKFHIRLGENEFDSYVTRNGKLLFIEGIDLEKEPETTEQPEEEKLTCEDLKKTGEPLLEAFVVSKCPFGLQMQRILNEIIKNIPSLASNVRVEYMGAIENGKIIAMHGDEEAEENLRQTCLREEQPNKYWDYIDCHIKKGDIESCLVGAGIDKGKLDSCMSENSRGLKYAGEDFGSQDKYKVTGSPTLFLNGEKVSEFDFGGRNAEAVKTLLCCGFETEPSICAQKLLETQAATGFSETYTQSGGSSGGSCE